MKFLQYKTSAIISDIIAKKINPSIKNNPQNPVLISKRNLTCQNHEQHQNLNNKLSTFLQNKTNTFYYAKKETFDLIFATKRQRTCFLYRKRHWFTTHRQFLDQAHFSECKLFKHSKVCIQFAKLLKNVPLDHFSISLLQVIIGTYDIFNQEIKKT